jgi:hypothetical protein
MASTVRSFRKGHHVLILSGRFQGEAALVVAQGLPGMVSVSRLGEDFDVPIYAAPPTFLERISGTAARAIAAAHRNRESNK